MRRASSGSRSTLIDSSMFFSAVMRPWYSGRGDSFGGFVEKSLSAAATNEPRHSLRVGEFARGVPEVKLGEIPLQVLARDMVIGAVERTLQLREVVLGLVRRHIAPHVFAVAVVHG